MKLTGDTTMANKKRPIALYYDDGGYIETLSPPNRRQAGTPAGLMGRQVASKEFLDAYLTYGDWTEVSAVVPDTKSGKSLAETCRTHASSRGRRRKLRLFELKDFQSRFIARKPARVLHFPCPPEIRFAWARQCTDEPDFALCGVTHTLCSIQAIDALRNFVIGPFEPFDRLICTSRAVSDMVHSVTGNFAEYLRDRFGGSPSLRIGLEVIPLGIDTNKFRPATPEERRGQRQRLQVAPDEVVVLYVGRLSHHAKAHPFPMFRGLSQAVDLTRQKVHLILSGWAANSAIHEGHLDVARRCAPNVRVSVVDGTNPENRFTVWQAADIFTSLSDNIQETFGLVVVEAMASGLPVVASDWNGYRDLVMHDETGFLVSTWMIRDTAADATLQLLLGEVDYDHFLARTNQCVMVDVTAATNAYASLLHNAELRQRMGCAGRRRVEQHFAWQHVIRAYESLWEQQETERVHCVRRGKSRKRCFLGPAVYPPLERSFAGYATAWLDSEECVTTAPDACDRLEELLTTNLVNYESSERCCEAEPLRAVLAMASTPCTLADLESQLGLAKVCSHKGRMTLAWLLKYDLLRRVRG